MTAGLNNLTLLTVGQLPSACMSVQPIPYCTYIRFVLNKEKVNI